MSAPRERKLQETGKNQVSASKESQRIRKVRKTISRRARREQKAKESKKTRGESLLEEREREREKNPPFPLPLREKSLKELARNYCNGKERSVTDRQIARYDDENSYF